MASQAVCALSNEEPPGIRLTLFPRLLSGAFEACDATAPFAAEPPLRHRLIVGSCRESSERRLR